jgi:hypothetical protein
MNDSVAQGLIFKILYNQPIVPSDCEETMVAAASQTAGFAAVAAPTAFIEVTVQASGSVSVRDAANHTASVGSDGNIVNDIPLSTFEVLGEMTTITLPVTSTYTLTLQQTGAEPGKVRVTDFRTLSSPEDFDPYQRAVFVDVPSAVGGIATLAINYTAGMSSLQLLLDQDGNGSNDQTLPPTSVLDQTQSQDYSLPATVIQVNGSKTSLGFYTGPVTVTLSASDTGTGVLKTEYSLDGIAWQTYSAPFVVTAEEIAILFARSVDIAGNQEYPSIQTRLSPLKVFMPLVNR